MHPHPVMNAFGRRLAPWRVRGDDEYLVASAAEMLDHAKHRVGDAVDIREEGLCNDCNAHTRMVAAAPVAEVASGDTTR